MTTAEMIAKLMLYPPDTEVKITDGFNYRFYEGNFEFQLFQDTDGSEYVDIGIGGFEVDHHD